VYTYQAHPLAQITYYASVYTVRAINAIRPSVRLSRAPNLSTVHFRLLQNTKRKPHAGSHARTYWSAWPYVHEKWPKRQRIRLDRRLFRNIRQVSTPTHHRYAPVELPLTRNIVLPHDTLYKIVRWRCVDIGYMVRNVWTWCGKNSSQDLGMNFEECPDWGSCEGDKLVPSEAFWKALSADVRVNHRLFHCVVLYIQHIFGSKVL